MKQVLYIKERRPESLEVDDIMRPTETENIFHLLHNFLHTLWKLNEHNIFYDCIQRMIDFV